MSAGPIDPQGRQAEEATLIAIADAMSQFVALIRGDKIVHVNPAGCVLLGRPRDHFVGRDFWEFALAQDQGEVRDRERARQAGVEQPRRFTRRLRHADGHDVWIDYSVDVLSVDGKPTTLVTGHDVTAQHRTEDALRLNEERFRSVFQNAAIGKAIVTPDLRFKAVNSAYCAMFGYSEAELLTMSPSDLTHPSDGGGYESTLHRMIRGELSSGRSVKCYQHKDGRPIWGDLTITLLRDAQGKPHFFIGEVVDVTERMRTEDALRLSEELFRAAFQNAAIAKAITKPDLTIIEINEAACRMLGYEEREFLGRSTIQVTHPDDRAQNEALVARLLAGEVSSGRLTNRYLHKNGRTVWGELTRTLVRDAAGRPLHFLSEIVDVTERRTTEESLRSSEQRFRNLHTQAPVMMNVVGPDRRIREVSNFWLSRMGYERHEVIGREGREFLAPESYARLIEEHERTLAAGDHVLRSVPIVAIRKDGTTVDVLTTSVLEFDEQGQFAGVVTVGMDVTHIRRAEEAIRESEARYRALVEHAPEAIAVLDVESGTFIDLNSNVEGLFGQPRERILGMGPLDFAPEFQPDGQPSAVVAERQIARVRAGETPMFEFTCRHSSGREFPCQIRLSRLPTKGRELVRSSVTDISELKELQEKVRHTDRMAAIGVLAAGVAHEIGNPLLALSMAAQSLERKLADEYASRKLALIREHIERISKIVRQMSDLARPRAAVRASCDLNRVVERALEIIRYDRRAKAVDLRFEPSTEVPRVQAVEDQLMQVCLNLGLNALDAVAENPPARARSLVIRTQCVEIAGRPHVRTSFKDSGPGVPESARSRIFQPFFTTKAPGQGTGLGLSVSYRIIQDHAGALGFECPPGSGAEFFFAIPAEERS